MSDVRQREITMEIWREFLSGSFLPMAKRSKKGSAIAGSTMRRTLPIDTGLVAQEFAVGNGESLPDMENLAGSIRQAAIIGFIAAARVSEQFPEPLRWAANFCPCYVSDIIASLLCSRLSTDGEDKAEHSGVTISFDKSLIGFHERADPGLVLALKIMDSGSLVVLSDTLEILRTLLEMRKAAIKKRWAYVSAAMFHLGVYVERAENRRYERDTARGKGAIASAAAGGRTRRKLSDGEAENARAEREALRAAGHSKTDACRIVAEKLTTGEFSVGYKTISRL